jgi:hypothetical protein
VVPTTGYQNTTLPRKIYGSGSRPQIYATNPGEKLVEGSSFSSGFWPQINV